MVKLSIETLESYIHFSLGITKRDATSLGCLAGPVIELLGRFMRIHTISPNGREPHHDWFYDFIEKYLKKYNDQYYNQRKLLWKNLRNESAHAVLATTAITWSEAEWIKTVHLSGHYDPRIQRKSLLIWTSKFAEDLNNAVADFFNDVRADKVLEQNCQKSFSEIYSKGQSLISEQIDQGVLSITSQGIIEIG